MIVDQDLLPRLNLALVAPRPEMQSRAATVRKLFAQASPCLALGPPSTRKHTHTRRSCPANASMWPVISTPSVATTVRHRVAQIHANQASSKTPTGTY